jgi:hypothetical protein
MVEVKFDLVKRDFFWIGLIVVLFAVGFSYAYGGSSPSVMGHSWEEIEITDEMCNYIAGDDCAGNPSSDEDSSDSDEDSSSGETYLAFTDSGEYLDCDDDSFAAALYKVVGGRCPEASGLRYWENSYYAKKLKDTFTTSYYSACGTLNFDRCNDELLCDEGDDYVDNTENCVSSSGGYYRAITDSGEYLDCDDDSFVAALYKVVGGRCPEASGLRYWENSYYAEKLEEAFSNAYASDCGTANFDRCNDDMLCDSGDDYIENTRYCES